MSKIDAMEDAAEDRAERRAYKRRKRPRRVLRMIDGELKEAGDLTNKK